MKTKEKVSLVLIIVVMNMFAESKTVSEQYFWLVLLGISILFFVFSEQND